MVNCYGRMYDSHPTDKCMTCGSFNKCKLIGFGVPLSTETIETTVEKALAALEKEFADAILDTVKKLQASQGLVMENTKKVFKDEDKENEN